MAVTLETIHKDMQNIRKELSFLRHVMEEDFELGDETKQRLEKVRHDMNDDKFITNDKITAKYS